MKKYLIVVILALLTCATYCLINTDPTDAEGDNPYVYGGIQYSLSSPDGINGTAEMMAWDGETTDIVIPSKIHSTILIDGDSAELDFNISITKAVFKNNTSIKSLTISDGDGTVSLYPEMFSGCSALKTVSLGNVITVIPVKCFNNDSALESVEWSDKLTSINNFAFQYCGNIKDLCFKEGLVSIGESAFNGCTSLTELQFPNSLTTIGPSAFAMLTSQNALPMSIDKVTFGNKLASVGTKAFLGCQFTEVLLPDSLTSFTYTVGSTPWPTSLKSISVSSEHTTLATIDGVLYNKAVSTLYLYPYSKTGSYIMPDTVTALQGSVLKDTLITDIHISTGLTSLPMNVFSGCTELKTLDLSNYSELKSMGIALDCISLETVIFNENLASIPASAFKGCKSLNIQHLPQKLTSIGASAFNGTGITSLVVGEYGLSIAVGKGAFYDCNELTYIKFNDISVKTADYGRLANGAKLTSIEYGEGFALWNSDGVIQKSNDGTTLYAVLGGATGEIIVPKEVTSLPVDSNLGSAFKNASNISSIVFESGRTSKLSIGKEFFSGCSKLESVTFSSNIFINEKTSTNIFQGCDSLKYIAFPVSDFAVISSVFTVNGYEYYHFNGVNSAKAPTTEELLGTVWVSNGDQIFNKVAETVGGILTPLKFEISFNVDGVDKITAEYGSEVTKPADPVKTGYTFVNWYSDEALENVYEFTTMPAENIVLYAKLIPIEYIYTFVNGADRVGEIKFTVMDMADMIMPAVPVKEHYLGVWDVTVFSQENKIVNAVYTPIRYTFTFMDGEDIIKTVEFNVENVNTMAMPAVPAKANMVGHWDAIGFELEDKTVNAVYEKTAWDLEVTGAGEADKVFWTKVNDRNGYGIITAYPAEFQTVEMILASENGIIAKLSENAWIVYSDNAADVSVRAVFADVGAATEYGISIHEVVKDGAPGFRVVLEAENGYIDTTGTLSIGYVYKTFDAEKGLWCYTTSGTNGTTGVQDAVIDLGKDKQSIVSGDYYLDVDGGYMVYGYAVYKNNVSVSDAVETHYYSTPVIMSVSEIQAVISKN